jgi:hypothetical protein
MLVEIGFIVFIISAYIYFLYSDSINSLAQNAYKFSASLMTVAITFSGAYYLYKHPDQIALIREMMLKKTEKKA